MRISGITIPEDKNLGVSLTVVYGMGRPLVKKILEQAGVDSSKKTKDISVEEENKIRELIEQCRIEGDLRRDVSGNIKRLKEIKTYRGTRHSKKLPARGQRTKTNSRTIRGNVRKTMGSGKKSADKK